MRLTVVARILVLGCAVEILASGRETVAEVTEFVSYMAVEIMAVEADCVVWRALLIMAVAAEVAVALGLESGRAVVEMRLGSAVTAVVALAEIIVVSTAVVMASATHWQSGQPFSFKKP